MVSIPLEFTSVELWNDRPQVDKGFIETRQPDDQPKMMQIFIPANGESVVRRFEFRVGLAEKRKMEEDGRTPGAWMLPKVVFDDD